MNFLAPWFLVGALAVALPVVFHLVRKTAKQRTVFSSLMFLQSAPPRITRRNRLEDPLLLLLRGVAVCLLATAFARPFFKHAFPEHPPAEPPRRIVVLVDTSASMRRADLWAAAREKAEAVLRKTSPADRLALFTFDRQCIPRVTFEEWTSTPAADRVALARSRLAESQPGWSATHLDLALSRAAELLAGTEDGQAEGRGQIIVISDFQEGTRLGGLQGLEWPKGVEVVSERVPSRPTSNAGLQLLADAGDAPRSTNAGVRVRVSNEPDSRREQFRVGWAREDGSWAVPAAEVYVPAGQARIVTLAVPEAGVGTVRIVLRGDDEEFDDAVFAVPPEMTRLRVLYLGGDAATDSRQPLYFVRRAFQETRGQAVEVFAKPASAALTADELGATPLLIVTDALPAATVRSLGDAVAQGRTLLFAPTGSAAVAALAGLPGLERLVAEERAPEGYALLGEIDFRHPLFLPFADARYSDFTKIHFWRHRRLDIAAVPGARVPARFDNGDAAIVEIPVGKGRVLVLASGWHPADSQLAVSSKFVPLLYSALELAGGPPTAAAQFVVGDTIPLAAEWRQPGGEFTITRPDGLALTLAAGETNFTQTIMPGVYRVNTDPKPRRFAVNLDAAESRTTPLPLDALERLGAPVPGQPAGPAHETRRQVLVQSAELEGQQKLWRGFILAALAVLLIETWLAGRIGRRRIPQGEAVT
jgi:hypothetical protein